LTSSKRVCIFHCRLAHFAALDTFGHIGTCVRSLLYLVMYAAFAQPRAALWCISGPPRILVLCRDCKLPIVIRPLDVTTLAASAAAVPLHSIPSGLVHRLVAVMCILIQAHVSGDGVPGLLHHWGCLLSDSGVFLQLANGLHIAAIV
jgi:hypothetical protein